VDKNKLHNRHLFGSGVVCGLEVKCAPCDSGFVSVAAGYALSPCGEDIVVCKQDMVDICALIARCRTDTEPDCAPYRGQDSCGEVIEDWILSIRYAESPSRGITPLTGAGQGCGCSCAGPCSGKCGGGSTCGCGGGPTCSCGAAKGLTDPEPLRQPRLNRGAPPSCEPTLTCETYRYDVFRAPEEKPRDPRGEVGGIAGIFSQLEGDMFARITCCLKELEASIPKAPGDTSAPIADADKAKWFAWACQVRTALANYLVRVGAHDCQAIAKLQSVVIPSPAQPAAAFTAALQFAELQMALLVFEAIIACFCSNALPPCPPPGDPRVPLALVKVRRGDCTVISVCNWTPLRKHVLTFPTLEYWFGWIPIERLLRTAMHNLCCNLFGLRELFGQRYAAVEMREEAPAAPAGMERPQAAGAVPRAMMMEQEAPGFDSAVPLDVLAGAGLNTGLLEAVLLRQQINDGKLSTLGDIARASLERATLNLDESNDKDGATALRKAAASPAIGLLAEMARSVTQPALGLANLLAHPGQAHPQIVELNARIDRQQQEIAALKRKMRPTEAPARAAPAAAKTRRSPKPEPKPQPPAPASPRGRGRAPARGGRGRNK
jgi:hypothetical protein